MKNKSIFSIIAVFLFTFTITGQTPKKVNMFPEEYNGKLITFKNIWLWPILNEFNGYYTVQLDISDAIEISDNMEIGFKVFNKIAGAVRKDIAKQMINKDIGGYNSWYYGTVQGTVLKSNKMYYSEYILLITKIIIHKRDDFDNPIEIFQSINKK
jgi:hypothetical protein